MPSTLELEKRQDPRRQTKYISHEKLINEKRTTRKPMKKLKMVREELERNEDKITEGETGWVIQGVVSSAVFCWQPRSGQKSITVMSLHINNNYAKKRGIRKKPVRLVKGKWWLPLPSFFGVGAASPLPCPTCGGAVFSLPCWWCCFSLLLLLWWCCLPPPPLLVVLLSPSPMRFGAAFLCLLGVVPSVTFNLRQVRRLKGGVRPLGSRVLGCVSCY